MTRRLALLLPGDPDTATGGYLYDRHVVAELRALGWDVQVGSLDASFPAPTAVALEGAAGALAALPDGSLVLVDGLAGGAMPRELAAQATRLRLVALVHHPLAAETGLDAAVAHRLRDSEREALRAMRAVVVTSEETADALRRDYGVPPRALAVIEPGAPEPAPARGARRPGPLRLLCVATLVPRKGHALLLRALADCGDATGAADWQLDCVGSASRDPACADALRGLACELQLGSRVQFHGEVSPRALQSAYADADLFVLPAWYEGYGMAVAEAVAHGLPVLATAVGAAPRVLDGTAGLLVPPGDAAALGRALRQLLGDAALRGRLAAGAAARARALPRWRDAGAQFAALLARVAAA